MEKLKPERERDREGVSDDYVFVVVMMLIYKFLCQVNGWLQPNDSVCLQMANDIHIII